VLLRRNAAHASRAETIPKTRTGEHGPAALEQRQPCFTAEVPLWSGPQSILTSANNFETDKMFVPIIVLMVLAVGLNSLIGWLERVIAPWQAEIAGREQN